ncbi:CKLF factor, partial [Donacobius atricapilla]|nr:CKLF factor [Donacobius atricapilla]
VHWAFLRSARGALKIARTVRPGPAPGRTARPWPALTPSPPVPQLVALAALICFVASGAPKACTALAVMETVITALFLLLYLLRVDKRMRLCFHYLFQDILNSVISALFLLVVGLFAITVKTNKGTLAGGVLALILLVLCFVDAVLLYKKIVLDKARGGSAPAK